MSDHITVESELGAELLRDQPARDIMRSILSSHHDYISPVLGGLAMYLRKVHPGPYAPELVEVRVIIVSTEKSSCSLFFSAERYECLPSSFLTVNLRWRERELDVNSLLDLCATVIKARVHYW
jgi:hypothetical protein